MKAKKSKPTPDILWVEVLEAKTNKLFTEAQRQSVRFLRYNRAVPCAECCKKRRVMWTMLCTFIAHSMPSSAVLSFTFKDSGKEHPPLTPVCGDHPLAPSWPKK